MRGSRRTWTARIAIAVSLWLVVCGLAFWWGNHPKPGLIALLLTAGATTLWLFLDSSAAAEPANWTLVPSTPLRQPGEDPRLALLARVIGQHLDAREVGDGLHRHLMPVADHRLVAHHGVSLRADPERAAELMGPELSSFLTRTDPYPRLTVEQIDVLISRIEAL